MPLAAASRFPHRTALAPLILGLSLGWGLIACTAGSAGGGGSVETPRPTSAPAPPAPAAAAPMPAASPAAAAPAVRPATAAAPPTAGQAAPSTAAGSAGSGSGTSSGEPAAGGNSAAIRNALPFDRMIIRTAQLVLTVDEVDNQLRTRIMNAARGFGGWIATEQMSQVADGKNSATMTIKVPVEQYEPLMGELRGLGTVTSERATSQDVTEEFEDVQAQVKTLEVLEGRYQDLLARAATLDDTVKLTQKITEVRGQINKLQGRLVFLNRKADYSEISLQLNPKLPAPTPTPTPVPRAQDAWEPATEFRAAARTLLGALRGLATLAIWGVTLGGLPALGLGAALYLWRRHRRAAAAGT